jgi:superfamily II DNA or RNA helicase
MNYADFITRKTQDGADSGFEPTWMPDMLFDFQKAVVEWAVRKGRAAIFEECGLGKTGQGLTWGVNVARHTNKPTLYLTPLAVGAQTMREAEKFGVDAFHSRDGNTSKDVVITNYERLHYFNSDDFGGVVCDESGCLKDFDGERRQQITTFMRKVPYRLLQTATPSPNDYMELGTSSEALGYLGYQDMVSKFFIKETNKFRFEGRADGWRLKGHAELPFWRWVCSWARALRQPSDMGFDDSRFVLPPLETEEHVVKSRTLADGMLFALPAFGLKEQREELRRTIAERCEKVAELVNRTGEPALVWCQLNDEGNLLERLIPDAVQVSGADSDDAKEGRLEAFTNGGARVLVIKPKIGAWGLNFQHCAHTTMFPSHSFEQYYQSVRRLWRFGQKRPVKVDIVTTEGQRGVLDNLQNKQNKAEEMFARLVAEMNNALGVTKLNGTKALEVPAWLS